MKILILICILLILPLTICHTAAQGEKMEYLSFKEFFEAIKNSTDSTFELSNTYITDEDYDFRYSTTKPRYSDFDDVIVDKAIELKNVIFHPSISFMNIIFKERVSFSHVALPNFLNCAFYKHVYIANKVSVYYPQSLEYDYSIVDDDIQKLIFLTGGYRAIRDCQFHKNVVISIEAQENLKTDFLIKDNIFFTDVPDENRRYPPSMRNSFSIDIFGYKKNRIINNKFCSSYSRLELNISNSEQFLFAENNVDLVRAEFDVSKNQRVKIDHNTFTNEIFWSSNDFNNSHYINWDDIVNRISSPEVRKQSKFLNNRKFDSGEGDLFMDIYNKFKTDSI